MKLYEYVLKITDKASSSLLSVAGASKKADSALKEVSKSSKKAADSGGMLGSVFGNTGRTLAAAFSLASIVAFGNQIIQTRGEFQKFEAVLTNTLGSKSAAQRELGMISDLAAKTNFGVTELTNSYVKMVNRGMKPTSKELMNLADLANSTGKDYNQLTEAILDAQTGEFERLKEFGIRAEKNGDKVKFTFKGVAKEVKFSSEAIGDYITKLGELEGVSGSTVAISQTLTGQMSNLGDSFDRLFNVIGSRSESVLGKAIAGFSTLLNNISDTLMTEEEFIKRSLSESTSKYASGIQSTFDQIRDYARSTGKDVKNELGKAFGNTASGIGLDIYKAQEALAKFDKENKTGIFGSGVGSGIFGLTTEQQKQREQLLGKQVDLQEKLNAVTDAYNNALKPASATASAASSATKKGIDDTIRGGAKATTVNISINKMIEKMAETINFANTTEGAQDLEQSVLDALNRVINGAVYTARQ